MQETLPPAAAAAVLAAMTRKAIKGDTRAAKIILDEQRAHAAAVEPVKIIWDIGGGFGDGKKQAEPDGNQQ